MTRVKICGITRLEDALAAIDAGADMLGFNFHPPSPRSILPAKCAPITGHLRREHPQVTLVGVFVNLPVEKVNAIMEKCGLDLAQLHGDEPAEMLAAFTGRAFKALRGIPDDSAKYADYTIKRKGAAPALLVDALVKGLYGGSGITTDWAAAAALASRLPLLLAGGLTPENVAGAVRQVRPWGVDSASGVESAPGLKDPAKIRAFIEAVRGMDEEQARSARP
jgi:phosphoribosylanthranilate isomerase